MQLRCHQCVVGKPGERGTKAIGCRDIHRRRMNAAGNFIAKAAGEAARPAGPHAVAHQINFSQAVDILQDADHSPHIIRIGLGQTIRLRAATPFISGTIYHHQRNFFIHEQRFVDAHEGGQIARLVGDRLNLRNTGIATKIKQGDGRGLRRLAEYDALKHRCLRKKPLAASAIDFDQPIGLCERRINEDEE